MRGKLFVSLVFAVFLGPVSFAQAAERYVRADASGTGNGTSWSDAYTSFPSTWNRGDTYYVADGTYSGGSITTARNGTTPIIIKKATISSHGSQTGWSDAFGDGVADIGTWNITEDTGYITFDGAYAYGFRVVVPTGSNTSGFSVRNDNGAGHSIPNLTFKFLEVAGAGVGNYAYPWNINDTPRGIRIWGGLSGNPTYPNWYVGNCLFHGLVDGLFLDRAHNLLAENNDLAFCNAGAGGQHPDLVWISNSNDCIWRYNRLRDFNVEGLEVSGTSNNWKVYGNLVYNKPDQVGVARFVELHTNGSYANHQYYNNTLVNLFLGFRFMPDASQQTGHVVRNNLSYNVGGNEFTGGAADYNWNSGANSTGPHGIAGGSAQPFANLAARDFHITSEVSSTLPRNKGDALILEYATDLEGNVRGSDGSWDMGAYEFSSGSATSSSTTTSSAAASSGGATSGGNSSSAEGTSSSLSAGTSSGASSSGNGPFLPETIVEAENGQMQGPMAARVDATASNGFHVSTTANELGALSFVFSVAIAGDYYLQVSVLTPDPAAGHDSFYVGMDEPAAQGQDSRAYDATLSAAFAWDNVSLRGNGSVAAPEFDPKVWPLSAGLHTVTFFGRESDTRLDRLVLKRIVGTSASSGSASSAAAESSSTMAAASNAISSGGASASTVTPLASSTGGAVSSSSEGTAAPGAAASCACAQTPQPGPGYALIAVGLGLVVLLRRRKAVLWSRQAHNKYTSPFN